MISALKILVFVKDNYKAIAFGILAIAVVYLYFRATAEHTRAVEAEKGRDAAIALSNGWQSTSVTYANKLGDQVTRTTALELDKVNVTKLANSRELYWLQKFEGLKKNNGNLQSAETFEISLETEKVHSEEIKIPCPPKDTIMAFKYAYKDAWNDIRATVLDTPKLEIRDRYYAVIELKRPKGWLWKFQWSKRDAVSEITNSNKLIKIDSVAVITVK